MSTASANRSTRVCIREWINKLESNEYESRVTSDCLLHLIKVGVVQTMLCWWFTEIRKYFVFNVHFTFFHSKVNFGKRNNKTSFEMH